MKNFAFLSWEGSILLLLSFTTACGVSPLLHHDKPLRSGPDPRIASQDGQSDKPCDARFAKVNGCIRITWDQLPVVIKESPFEVEVKWEDSNRSADNLRLAAEIFMPSMGHGGHGKVQVTAVTSDLPARSRYRATNVIFNMGGRWELRLRLFDSSGTLLDSANIPITLGD